MQVLARKEETTFSDTPRAEPQEQECLAGAQL